MLRTRGRSDARERRGLPTRDRIGRERRSGRARRLAHYSSVRENVIDGSWKCPTGMQRSPGLFVEQCLDGRGRYNNRKPLDLPVTGTFIYAKASRSLAGLAAAYRRVCPESRRHRAGRAAPSRMNMQPNDHTEHQHHCAHHGHAHEGGAPPPAAGTGAGGPDRRRTPTCAWWSPIGKWFASCSTRGC